MAFMTEPERAFATVVSRLVLANPFLPRWVDTERKALDQNIMAVKQRVEAFRGHAP